MIDKLLRLPGLLLYPFSILYGCITWVRNRLFDYNILQSVEFDIPVISVGNITVGGTGKTPQIEYLVNMLQGEFKVATLSRGYKRKTSGFFLATPESAADEIGDEPRQIKQKFESLTVAVDSSRVRGINHLLKLEKNLDVVLLDDAFQHRYVKPGVSILLTDFNRSMFDDKMLPFGNLREFVSERSRADAIIVTKCPDQMKPIDQRLLEKGLKMHAYQKVFFTKLNYANPVPVFGKSSSPFSLDGLAQSQPDILLLTGIANNQGLAAYVKTLTKNFLLLSYPDHHEYSAEDMHKLIEIFTSMPSKNKIILTTEKDAMRIAQFTGLEDEVKNAMYYLPITIAFLNNDEKEFNHYITSYVRNNKPDNILHKAKNKQQA